MSTRIKTFKTLWYVVHVDHGVCAGPYRTLLHASTYTEGPLKRPPGPSRFWNPHEFHSVDNPSQPTGLMVMRGRDLIAHGFQTIEEVFA